MAKVYLTSTALQSDLGRATQLHPLREMTAFALSDENRRHSVVDDPADAELIIFCEIHLDTTTAGIFLEQITRHPIYRRFPTRCIVHCGMDRVLPLIPGIYPSMEAHWHRPSLARSGPYLVERNPFLRYEPLQNQPEGELWLACFFGNGRDEPVRRRIMKLDDPRIRLVDSVQSFLAAIHSKNETDHKRHHHDFVTTAIHSKFMLCPRGTGSSSFRLFEAMQMGRAPVIISDAWVEPKGLDWSSFSIRVSERRVTHLPQILREHEDRAILMGENARKAWEDHFGPAGMFHWTVEQGLSLLNSRISRSVAYPYTVAQVVRPYHLRRLYRIIRSHWRSRANPRSEHEPSRSDLASPVDATSK